MVGSADTTPEAPRIQILPANLSCLNCTSERSIIREHEIRALVGGGPLGRFNFGNSSQRIWICRQPTMAAGGGYDGSWLSATFTSTACDR